MTLEEKLRKAAKKATPGQWKAFIGKAGTYDVHVPCTGSKSYHDIVAWPGFDSVPGTKKQRADNARYIALANPENIIALLDKIDAMSAAIQKHKEDKQEPEA